MKKFLLVITVLVAGLSAWSQNLTQVSFSEASTLTSFSFLTSQGVLIRVSENGKVLEWGTELRSQRSDNYFATRLQPYLGRVDYYGPESDSISRGKVKSIGTCVLTYFGPYEIETQKGKLKSIGSTSLDYYSNFENASFKGKLRFAGSLLLEYYSSVENEAYRGKLKSVGSTPLTYYSTFDDRLIKGKIKSIGTIPYTWYTSLDRKELRGALKSGAYRQSINGVTYILL